MKTTITTIAASLMIMLSLNSFAAPKVEESSTVATLANNYLSAITKGNISIKSLALADNFEYHNISNDTKAGKKQYSNFLKATNKLAYNCETSLSIIDETTNTSIAKVTMQFENFTRVDYITLCRQDNTWQISKVVTTYP